MFKISLIVVANLCSGFVRGVDLVLIGEVWEIHSLVGLNYYRSVHFKKDNKVMKIRLQNPMRDNRYF